MIHHQTPLLVITLTTMRLNERYRIVEAIRLFPVSESTVLKVEDGTENILFVFMC